MSEPRGDAAVRLDGVTKTFRLRGRRGSAGHEVVAVRDVSLDVRTGSCLGIAGESGSGKSTIARMMVGLETPSAGSIEVTGHVLPERPGVMERRLHARRVQMVFQDPYSSLDPRQPVSSVLDEVQQVHFPDRSRERRETRTLQLLDAVGLGERYRSVLPRVLSGGQRQRLAIARALAGEPAVLVLDEAVSALDVSTQAQILNLLSDLRDEFQLTYVFISHDLAVIRQVADDVMVLYRGRVMEQAPVTDVFDAAANPYSQLLLSSVPRPDMPLTRHTVRPAHNDEGCLFASRCPKVHERCQFEPELLPVSAVHQSRCWLAAQQSNLMSAPPKEAL